MDRGEDFTHFSNAHSAQKYPVQCSATTCVHLDPGSILLCSLLSDVLSLANFYLPCQERDRKCCYYSEFHKSLELICMGTILILFPKQLKTKVLFNISYIITHGATFFEYWFHTTLML